MMRMHRTLRAALLGCALACLLLPAAAAASAGRTTSPGTVLRGLDNARDLGTLAPARTLHIGIGLRGRDDAARARFVRALYDRHSPQYHRFLTPAQYARRFGAPSSRLAATVRWLRAGGLRVRRVPGASSYVLASGSAEKVSRLLRTSFHGFAFQGHRYYANVAAPSVPESLGVLAVTGLNSFEGPRLNHPDRKRAQRPQLPHTLGPGTDVNTTSPSDLWSIYDQPSDNKGEGQQMAIFGWGTTNNTTGDLRLFEREHQFPAMDLEINYYGTEKKVTDSGGEVEWDLDTQASTGMAPNAARETLYFGRAGTDPDLIAAYNAWAADRNGALQGSSSFGGCEQAPGTDAVGGSPGNPAGVVIAGNPNQALYEQALTQAVAEGRTMFASTGDTGAGCPAVALVLNGVTVIPTPMLNYPAVSPSTVAVGGTVLYFNDASADAPASRGLEYGWTHGGGGNSLFMPAPAWQQDVVSTPCVSDSEGGSGASGAPCRGIPDVSAQSGDIVSNGYGITEGGSPDQSGGGTSLSSPLWLGMWTRVQAAKPLQGKDAVGGNGFAAPALYQVAKDHADAFFDVGGASTDTIPTCNGATPLNCSHPGWDYLTGWGSPDVAKIARVLDGGTAPADTSGTPNPPPAVDEGRPDPCPAPQMADRTGDAPNGYPGGDGSNVDQLDIEGVAFGTEQDGSGAPALGITMKLANLSNDPVAAAMTSPAWDVHWTAEDDSGNEVTYDAQAVRDLAGPAAQYSFSVSGSDGTSSAVDGTATTGADGSLHWTIPLADLGSPPDGARLYGTFADTRGLVAILGSGLQYTAAADRAPDSGFGANWLIGGSCS